MAHAAAERDERVKHVHRLLEGINRFSPLDDELNYHALKQELGERPPEATDISYQRFDDVAVARNAEADETWLERTYDDDAYDGVLVDTAGDSVDIRAAHTRERGTLEDPDEAYAEGVFDDIYEDIQARRTAPEVVTESDVDHGISR